MLCPLCNTPNRDNAKFCKRCGQLLTIGSSEESQFQQMPPVRPVPGVAEALPIAPLSSIEQGENQPPRRSITAELEDLSSAPTQVLSPQQMQEYQARLNKQPERSQEKQPQAGSEDATADPTADNDEYATALVFRPTTSDPRATTLPPGGTEDISTAVPPSIDKDMSEKDQVTPTPAISTQMAVASNSTLSEKEKEIKTTMQEEEHVEQRMDTANDSAVGSNNFPVLSVGTSVGGRYEIQQVVKGSEDEHIYEVTDAQGYQYCWYCNSEDNTDESTYCNNCGAELLNHIYTMHEYPAVSKSGEETVMPANIINTLIENGLTYAIEQPQTAPSTPTNGVHLIASCNSDAGNLRRGEPNEDSTFVLVFERVHESVAVPAGVFIVADGMGGHANGQGASRMTINVIAERVVRELLMPPLSAEKSNEKSKELSDDGLTSLIRSAVEDANTELCQVNQRDKSDMGSTLTGFMVVGDYAYIFNVGDSRTYMLRDKNIYQLTNDHSLVGQLVAGGLITPEDVYTHPQRSQIYRSIGDKLNVQIDLIKQQVHPGDILLSCSDGLWEMVRDPKITEILNEAPDPQTACTQLIETANSEGGEDNVSAVVVFVR